LGYNLIKELLGAENKLKEFVTTHHLKILETVQFRELPNCVLHPVHCTLFSREKLEISAMH